MCFSFSPPTPEQLADDMEKRRDATERLERAAILSLQINLYVAGSHFHLFSHICVISIRAQVEMIKDALHVSLARILVTSLLTLLGESKSLYCLLLDVFQALYGSTVRQLRCSLVVYFSRQTRSECAKACVTGLCVVAADGRDGSRDNSIKSEAIAAKHLFFDHFVTVSGKKNIIIITYILMLRWVESNFNCRFCVIRFLFENNAVTFLQF